MYVISEDMWICIGDDIMVSDGKAWRGKIWEED